MRRPRVPHRHVFSLRLRPELVELLRAESCARGLPVTAVFAELVADHLGGFGLPRRIADLLEQDRLQQGLPRREYLRQLLALRYDQIRAEQLASAPERTPITSPPVPD